MTKFEYNSDCKDQDRLGVVSQYQHHHCSFGEVIKLNGNGPFICSDQALAELQEIFPDCYRILKEDAEIKQDIEDSMNSNEVTDSSADTDGESKADEADSDSDTDGGSKADEESAKPEGKKTTLLDKLTGKKKGKGNGKK